MIDNPSLSLSLSFSPSLPSLHTFHTRNRPWPPASSTCCSQCPRRRRHRRHHHHRLSNGGNSFVCFSSPPFPPPRTSNHGGTTATPSGPGAPPPDGQGERGGGPDRVQEKSFSLRAKEKNAGNELMRSRRSSGKKIWKQTKKIPRTLLRSATTTTRELQSCQLQIRIFFFSSPFVRKNFAHYYYYYYLVLLVYLRTSRVDRQDLIR